MDIYGQVTWLKSDRLFFFNKKLVFFNSNVLPDPTVWSLWVLKYWFRIKIVAWSKWAMNV